MTRPVRLMRLPTGCFINANQLAAVLCVDDVEPGRNRTSYVQVVTNARVHEVPFPSRQAAENWMEQFVAQVELPHHAEDSLDMPTQPGCPDFDDPQHSAKIEAWVDTLEMVDTCM